jgi:hypothetical protein
VGALVALGALVDLAVGALVALGALVDLAVGALVDVRWSRPASWTVTPCPTAAILRAGSFFSKATADELKQMTNAKIS